MTSRRRFAAIAALSLLGSALAASAGWKEVPVDIAVPARVRTVPGQKVLVTMFRANQHPRIDIGGEISRWVKREIARQTSLTVIDVPPPEIPEQRAEKLAVNDAFWRRLGEDFRADLIVAGIADYKVEDRSAFVNEDVESPLTGQTVRRSRFAERRGFRVRMQVFFLKGDNGALLHREIWTQERIIEGTGEDLQELFDLLEIMKTRLAATLLPTRMQEPRYIWVD